MMSTTAILPSVIELKQALAARELSARELVMTSLERIAAHDDRYHAFVSVAADQALAQADEADAQFAAGAATGPLAGIPLGVKDSIPTAGIRTTANSRLLEHWVPEHDAAPIARLRAAGAIVLGKTNLNEFGWALPTDSDLTPKAQNPWNPDYAAIGSSSGSGIAVAAGFVPAAIGTDGGGSARLPAGQHNLAGIKPTHGLVGRKGMDNSWISEISPMARTVADAALLLMVMAEPGNRLSNRPEAVPDYLSELETSIEGWRLGVPTRLIESAGLESEVADAFDETLRTLKGLGADIVEIELPGMAQARAANFIVLNAQAYAEHAVSLRTHPELYGQSARVYHWMGAFLSAADVLNARAVRRRVRELVQDTLTGVRAIVTPTSPVVTAEAARRPEAHRKGSNAIFTSPFNLTGHPAMSVPAGFSASTRLPIGVQLVGSLFDEITLFQIGHALERNSSWLARRIPEPNAPIAEEA
jgi:aspartyl-tRNA(Asn)/glutamyl-tRNA(Gln) amidotransferase subunit A